MVTLPRYISIESPNFFSVKRQIFTSSLTAVVKHFDNIWKIKPFFTISLIVTTGIFVFRIFSFKFGTKRSQQIETTL